MHRVVKRLVSNIRGATQNSPKLECRAKTSCSTAVLSNGLEKVTVTVTVTVTVADITGLFVAFTCVAFKQRRTKRLTPWRRALPEELVKKFPASYGTLKFRYRVHKSPQS